MSAYLPEGGRRFYLRHPQAFMANPVFLVPFALFPIAGALLVWFTRDDLERSAFYWVFFGGFQLVWIFSVGKFARDVRDPARNHIDVTAGGIEIQSFRYEKHFSYEEIEAVEERARGPGRIVGAWMTRPAGGHAVVRLRKPVWWSPLGGWPRSRELALDVQEREGLVEAVRAAMAKAGNLAPGAREDPCQGTGGEGT